MKEIEEIVKENVTRVETPDYMRTRISAAIQNTQDFVISRPRIAFASFIMICLVAMSTYSILLNIDTNNSVSEVKSESVIGNELFQSNQLYYD